MLATRQLLLRFQSHPSSRCCSWLSTTTAAASSSATAAAANNHHAAASNHHAATDAAVGRPRYIADNDQRSSTTTTAAAAATSNSAAAIRRDFVQYFVDRGHEHVKSSSLVPQNDPTLLFVNAGMVQFKDRFLHPRASSSGRLTSAVSVQKCMRAGGKHNDLTNVGYTPRHHTFFEMLGNFSFGGYFKETAIPLAWDYLTAHLQLPKDRLMITVYETDDESYAIWRDKIGVPESRIWRLGAADNYWSMGDGPGPCGPCTEIHFDLQNGLDARDPERYMEIWNVVFMQEQKVASSSGQLSLAPLETKCIDTGMGLERLARVLQGKASNFEIDSLASLTAATAAAASAASQASGQLATPPTAFLNIVADHVRAASFLIADGVIPSNLGRGYVLRRVIRRAAGVGLQMGLKKPFLADLVPVLLASTDPTFYPEIFARQTEICAILKQEEEVFSSALHSGVSMLNSEIDAAVQRKQAVLAPATVFRLHESHGFPIDLARIISTQRGVSFDEQAIEQMVVDNREMTRQRSRATGSAASLLTNANSKQETTQLKEAIVSCKALGLRSLSVWVRDSRIAKLFSRCS
ncbi:alanyl-tRNA synthetase [Capsaspora owczarzaki ATCC 30864]|uniref:Alanine--tRNA ligase n=1 Tax=Capsaspora owczarzaki (strain ATCC 30864) TaxID=595528 RepID=A0A0D2VSD9_CAPO3|nr:alanyl-tRNA synthetase [Capsaspora owczarzaki ATCC 30864]